ncbi:MAG TPA: serine hydrolase domain-containing protein [Gemmataceae bacterium]|nr:serine hydrolase domain-containing protein [Gemmataceae bacterium]
MLLALSGWSLTVLIGAGLFVLYLLLPTIITGVLRFRVAFVRDPVPTPVAATPPGSEVRDLADRLEPIRRRYKVPALAGAVVRDGKLTALGAVGVRRAGHAEPVTPADLFHLGSCTKAMTATLCARLVRQGKLRWNSSIAEVFPDVAPIVGEAYRAATLEHLLTHRAGIDEGFAFSANIWPKVWELTGPLDRQRVELMKLVLQGDPGTPLGTQYAYSNCGYAIAGAMCERVTGRPWEGLMRELIFDPLGMTSAGYGPPGTAAVDQPWGHRLGFWIGQWTPMPPGPKADNPAVIGPAGGVHCSLADWAKFVALHAGGADGDGSFLPTDTFRVLHSPTLGGDYAFGWSVLERDWGGGKVLMHNGSNTMWMCVVWLAPRRGLALLAATNLGTGLASAACDAAVGKLLDLAGEKA